MGSLLTKSVKKTPFLCIDLPSNIVDWKKWFYVYKSNAPAFSHDYPRHMLRPKADLGEFEFAKAEQLLQDRVFHRQ